MSAGVAGRLRRRAGAAAEAGDRSYALHAAIVGTYLVTAFVGALAHSRLGAAATVLPLGLALLAGALAASPRSTRTAAHRAPLG